MLKLELGNRLAQPLVRVGRFAWNSAESGKVSFFFFFLSFAFVFYKHEREKKKKRRKRRTRQQHTWAAVAQVKFLLPFPLPPSSPPFLPFSLFFPFCFLVLFFFFFNFGMTYSRPKSRSEMGPRSTRAWASPSRLGTSSIFHTMLARQLG